MGEVHTPPICHGFESSMPSLKSVKLPTDWTLNERDMCDLELLLSGAFCPLTTYLSRDNYFSVLRNMRLTTGEIWPMPIVLAIPQSSTEPNVHWMKPGEDHSCPDSVENVIKLRDKVGTVIAELKVTDIYTPDLELETLSILGTTDINHPYVDYLRTHNADCYYVSGEIVQKSEIDHFDFCEFRKTPKQVRELIKEKQWEVSVGFQTRNPMHCSHFELTRQATKEAEAKTGKKAHLLLTPAVGPTQPGDIEYHIRVRCYKKLLAHYPEGSVDMVLLPLAMRMAGPREAVFHAIIRKNYGCTHFIVGRDHAGPSTKKQDGTSFYGHYDAHKLLQSVENELGIEPIFGKAMVYVGPEFGGYVQADHVPVGAVPRNISGTELREALQARKPIPEWFSFPEIVGELHKFFLPLHKRGVCIYFTGLPCSGKSTLANAVEAALQDSDTEHRRITLLDADIIRTHLSRGLGFSKEDRSANVQRIGYVSAEIVKHRGICLVANIAPYEKDRKINRDIIERFGGGYIEVHVSTPIDVCETRDIKQLYKKARLGIVKNFSGVSDPYEVPESAEMTIDCTDDLIGKVKKVVDYCREHKWIL